MARRSVAEESIGRKFNRWTVVSTHPQGECSKIRVSCRCDCGVERIVPFKQEQR